MGIALDVSALTEHWDVPRWFDTLGAVISIAFLAAFGGLNLAVIIKTTTAFYSGCVSLS